RKGEGAWTDLYQHNLEATTAYLDAIKPEIPYGTHYSRQILLRDALSTPAHEVIPQHMRQIAFQQAKDLHSLRNQDFPGKRKQSVNLFRFAFVSALLMALNAKIVPPPFHIRLTPFPPPTPHLLDWQDTSPQVGASLADGSPEDTAYAVAQLRQRLALTVQIDDLSDGEEALASIAREAGALKDSSQGFEILKQTLMETALMGDDGWRGIPLAAIAQAAAELKDPAQEQALLEQTMAASEKIRSDVGRSDALVGIARGAGKLKDTVLSEVILEHALVAAEKIGDENWRVAVLSAIGKASGTQRDTDRGKALLEKVTTATDRITDEDTRGDAQAGIVEGYAGLGAQAQSIPLLEHALTTVQKIGNKYSRGQALIVVAHATESLKDKTQAGLLLEKTIALAEQISDDRSRAEALARAAQGVGALKHTAQALSLLEQATLMAQNVTDDSVRMEALTYVANGYASLGRQTPSYAGLHNLLTRTEGLNDRSRAQLLIGVVQGATALQNRAQTKAILAQTLTATKRIQDERALSKALAGISEGAVGLRDVEQSADTLAQTLAATERIRDNKSRAIALAGIAQGAWSLKERAHGQKILASALALAETKPNEWDANDYHRNLAITEVFRHIPVMYLLRQMEENHDPSVRRRIAEDLRTVLDTKMRRDLDDLEEGAAAQKRQVLIHQITPAVHREAFDENKDVRSAVEVLADRAEIPVPNLLEHIIRREITFIGFQWSSLFWFLLLLLECAAFKRFNRWGGASTQLDRKQSQSAKSPKTADSKILLRAAGYSDPSVRELLQAASLHAEDLERVVPHQIAKILDIHLQSLLVAAYASPNDAVPLLAELENRWEASPPEMRPGDVRQQVRVLCEILQAMVQHGPLSVREDARRCVTRLNHYVEVEVTASLLQGHP
ncbi:MAG: hypothetical protein JWN14_2145, partial [Chthonomonadales bacterium]|nr:hypothetical protein [Chthonomonadales bacterium]